jgi:hypothetical protein
LPRRRFLLAGLGTTLAAFGQGFGRVDFTGVWKLEGPESKAALLDVKMDGQTLTGKLKTPFGEFPIQDGYVSGLDLFFNVIIKRDEYELKTTYRGHLFDQEIQFSVEAGERLLQVIGRKANKAD